jgi:PAS domain S-box-containing protein
LTQTADDSQQTSGPPAPRDQWRIPAEPSRVPEVRHGVRAFAAAHGAPADVLGNLALAVTEAVTNAILHAYVDMEPGEVTVAAQAGAEELLVSVADGGRGMQPRPDSPGLGMGLPMIGQLTTSVDIRERPAGGTEVRMRFTAPGVRGPAEPAESDARLQLLVDVARLAQGGGWPQQGVGRLVHLLVPAIADACTLERLMGGEPERLAGVGAEPPPAEVPEGEEPQVAEAPDGPIAWWITLPLRDGERPIGLLRLGLAAGRGRPEPHDLVYLETLAERAARGLASGQLVTDLRRTRRRVERILDGLAEAVTVSTGDGQVVYANAAAASLLGAASVEEVVSARPGELAGRFIITLEDGSPVRDDDFPSARLLAGKEGPPLLTRSVLRATGEERWLLTKATVLDDEDERLAVSIIEDVTEAKLAERRARFLAHASEVLAASLDPEETLRGIAGLVVPHLADWCAIDLVDDGPVPRRVAVAHADPERLAFAEELQRRFPPYRDGVRPDTQSVLDGGPPLLVPEITDEMLGESISDPEELRLVRGVGMRSAIVLPLRAAGRTIGLLTMINAESARSFSQDELSFAEDVGRRAAVAVENARRFAARS